MHFGMDKYKLIIPHSIYHKVMWWVFMAKGLEVSGFGTIAVDHDKKTFTVEDAFLFKQENTASDTELDPDQLGKAMYECHKLGKELKWWWHSHHSMACFWSKTDEDTIKEIGEQGWILATVFNNKYEYKSAFYTTLVGSSRFDGKELKQEIFVEDLKTDIITFLKNEDIEKWEAEYNELVSEKKYVAPASNYHSSGSANAWRNWDEWGKEKRKKEDDEAGDNLPSIIDHSHGYKIIFGTKLEDLYDIDCMAYMKDPRFWWRKEYYDKDYILVPGRWVMRDDWKEFEKTWVRDSDELNDNLNQYFLR